MLVVSHWWIVLQPSCIFLCSLSRTIFCGRYAEISFADGGTDDGFNVDGKPRFCLPYLDHRCHLGCYACCPFNTSYAYSHEFFSSCSTNLSSTEATTRSHSERVAYVLTYLRGKMLLTTMLCNTAELLGASLIQDGRVQSVFYHELSLIRSPFSSGSHYRLKLGAGLLLVYGAY